MQRSCDPTRPETHGRDTADAMTDECVRCGGAIPSEEWHPVTTVRDDEGAIEIHGFCCATCRSAWLAERNADD